MHKVNTMENLADAIAKLVYKQYVVSLEKHNFYSLVLSGGNTPLYVFEAIKKNYLTLIDWSKVYVFWLDERCVDPDSSSSNYRLAKDNLLKFCAPSCVYRVKGEIEPAIAAKIYQDEIDEFFKKHKKANKKFDFVLLGMGEDGHVASLFPDSPELKSSSNIVATQHKYGGCRRISMNFPMINRTRCKVLLVTSESKLHMLRKMKGFPVHEINKNNLEIYLLVA